MLCTIVLCWIAAQAICYKTGYGGVTLDLCALQIDAGLARRKEAIDRVAADLGVVLEDKQRPSVPPSGAHPVG
ncbi:hypothetical protein Pmar_PMAR020761 [Perkinsus marinus ATCC 50983]|uniref:Uncharacterized protein n=1 Tax=Perkinsus marinus (strain ATCC 50983 / TXsc) TaxID=423536 RepID=C5KQS5_PERM5|nr:hypothetical protein Pmar_PMAR020761 [Perkinsus marinus ATCC 50983]EER13171.1 hypothetical protein Pmar_PMAR020761 [Perkinsus marinus ATCC 50983]|eukprot:XP_002781376.1 hypothetical protein Pmar_PMAR020761 [Perkinsus marinus ATCC 50983]